MTALYREGFSFRTNGDNKGFTLVELVLIILVLGVLAALIVPRYYSMSEKAEERVEKAFLGKLKSGLNLFAAKRIVEGERKHYPIVQSPLFRRVLEKVPENWSYTQSNGKIVHTRNDGSTKAWYYWINSDSSKFEIRTTFAAPPPPP